MAAARSPCREFATIVCVDLSRYSAISRTLEIDSGLGVEATWKLNHEIKTLIKVAMADVDATEDQVLIRWTGDGALLAFSVPADAERFAESVHKLAEQLHNRRARREVDYRCFRIGIVTGDILRYDDDVHGAVVCSAKRLEAAAKTGEILVDELTWSLLPLDHRQRYRATESVTGKDHDLPTMARRRRVTATAPWDTRLPLQMHEIVRSTRRRQSLDQADSQKYGPIRPIRPRNDTRRRRRISARRLGANLSSQRMTAARCLEEALSSEAPDPHVGDRPLEGVA